MFAHFIICSHESNMFIGNVVINHAEIYMKHPNRTYILTVIQCKFLHSQSKCFIYKAIYVKVHTMRKKLFNFVYMQLAHYHVHLIYVLN